jgi:hypothetical protein
MHNNKDQRNSPVGLTRFWIIGAGRFGQLAAKRITQHIGGARITVVDKQRFTMKGNGITLIRDDGIHWLHASLNRGAPVDLIIPAVPVHVTAEWLKLKIKKLYDIKTVKISDSWLSQMPNALPGATGQAFISHADFLCPDNCPEPEKICTHTGKTRPMDLFRLMGRLDIDNVLPIVIRSHQLLPGVGGIYPADLMSALDIVCKNSQRPLMIVTACRCHGVVDCIRLKSRRGADR